VRVRVPLGKKGLIAASALAAAFVYWRVRERRRDEEDRAWEEEIAGAVEEGRIAGRSAADAPDSGV
jgi:hypothetical protein